MRRKHSCDQDCRRSDTIETGEVENNKTVGASERETFTGYYENRSLRDRFLSVAALAHEQGRQLCLRTFANLNIRRRRRTSSLREFFACDWDTFDSRSLECTGSSRTGCVGQRNSCRTAGHRHRTLPRSHRIHRSQSRSSTDTGNECKRAVISSSRHNVRPTGTGLADR